MGSASEHEEVRLWPFPLRSELIVELDKLELVRGSPGLLAGGDLQLWVLSFLFSGRIAR